MINYTTDLIEKYENFRSKPYLCPAGVPTIGIGTTIYPDGRGVTLFDPEITLEEARMYLRHHINTKILPVLLKYNLNLNVNQNSALISFCYNCGTAPLRKLISKGKVNWERMKLYNKSKGKVLHGLVKRRQEEYELSQRPV